jgi:FMN-dependent oxidoreductase (nitrilotriacetate monooxygenase family)
MARIMSGPARERNVGAAVESRCGMHLNVLTQCIPSPIFEGMWRHEADRSATGYRTLDYWIDVARRLEDACIDALFFADFQGVYDASDGSTAPALRHGLHVPSIDPLLVISALAAATRTLGFTVTYCVSYAPPFQCARVFSTLDHLTGGRIGWNIVTSDLRLAEKTGLGRYQQHDERYDRADEYMEVVLRLWEESWSDDAVVRDAENDAFTDPGRVRTIEHASRWFRLSTPHQCEPSPQRTPVLHQAGSSPRGMEFAARHAEVVFVTLPGARKGAGHVARLRELAAEHGRDPRSLKILQGMPVLVAATEEEAERKADAFVSLLSRGGLLAKWCGWTGVDLAGHADDTPVAEILTQDGRSVLGFLGEAAPARNWTLADLRDYVATPHRPHRFDRLMLFGTPAQVADRMEEWLERADIDGFNLFPCPPSAGFDDICDLLVPELQRRGLHRTRYDDAERTLRERYLGAGNARYSVPRRADRASDAVSAPR